MTDRAEPVPNERPKPVSFTLPDPGALRGAAQRAIMVGQTNVAFPVSDVLNLAGNVETTIALMVGMRQIIEELAAAGRGVVTTGTQVLERARAEDVAGVAELFGLLEAQLQELDRAIPEADETTEAEEPNARRLD